PQNHHELLFVTATETGPSAEPEFEPELEVTDEPMKEVVAIIRPESWAKTKSRVEQLGIHALVQHRVVGRGRQRGLHFLARRGAKSGTGFRYLPKRMATWIVPASQVGPLVEAIMEANWTGQIGDGKIFVMPLDGVVRIGSDEQATILVQEDHSLAN